MSSRVPWASAGLHQPDGPSRSSSPATPPGALAGAIDFFGCGSPQGGTGRDDAPASPPSASRAAAAERRGR